MPHAWHYHDYCEFCTSHVGYLYPFCICFLDLVIIGGIMLESFFIGGYANFLCIINFTFSPLSCMWSQIFKHV